MTSIHSDRVYWARRAEQEAVRAIQALNDPAQRAHEAMSVAYSSRMVASLAAAG